METITISMTCLFVFTLVIAFIALAVAGSALLMFLHMRRRLYELMVTQENMIEDLQSFSVQVEEEFQTSHDEAQERNEVLSHDIEELTYLVNNIAKCMNQAFQEPDEYEEQPIEQVEMKARKRYKQMRKL